MGEPILNRWLRRDSGVELQGLVVGPWPSAKGTSARSARNRPIWIAMVNIWIARQNWAVALKTDVNERLQGFPRQPGLGGHVPSLHNLI